MSSHCCDPEPDQSNKKKPAPKQGAVNIAVLKTADGESHAGHDHGEDVPENEVHTDDDGHDHDHSDDDGHDHGGEASDKPAWQEHWDLLLSLAILAVILVMEYAFDIKLQNPLNFIINAIAYLLAGWSVLRLAFRKAIRGDIFNEFVLMSVATLGAFYIGEYTEGVAVMVFYSIGEWFQDSAVRRAKASIKALLDIRPDEVTVMRNGMAQVINPSEVQAGRKYYDQTR